MRMLWPAMLWLALVSAAILDGLVTIGLLVMWLRGIPMLLSIRNFYLPTPVVIILLNLIQLIIVVVAMFVSRFTRPPNETTLIDLGSWLHR